MVKSRLRLYPLFRSVRIASLAANNDFSMAGQRQYIDLDLPELVHDLVYAEEITFLSLAEAHTTNLQWGLFLYSGFNRGNESAPVQIGSTVTASGSLRHAVYTTVTNFQVESRLAIAFGYANGAAGVYTGIGTGALLVKYPGS